MISQLSHFRSELSTLWNIKTLLKLKVHFHRIKFLEKTIANLLDSQFRKISHLNLRNFTLSLPVVKNSRKLN